MGDSMNKRLRRILSQYRFVLKLDGQVEEVILVENSVVEHPLGFMESEAANGRGALGPSELNQGLEWKPVRCCQQILPHEFIRLDFVQHKRLRTTKR